MPHQSRFGLFAPFCVFNESPNPGQKAKNLEKTTSSLNTLVITFDFRERLENQRMKNQISHSNYLCFVKNQLVRHTQLSLKEVGNVLNHFIVSCAFDLKQQETNSMQQQKVESLAGK